MTREEYVEQVEKFIGNKEPKPDPQHLMELLSVCDELGLWRDHVTTVSIEQVVMCWRIIEATRTKEFPRYLWM